jgi:hypothetical protein
MDTSGAIAQKRRGSWGREMTRCRLARALNISATRGHVRLGVSSQCQLPLHYRELRSQYQVQKLIQSLHTIHSFTGIVTRSDVVLQQYV